jgi:large subunit ribosomal protein L28
MTFLQTVQRLATRQPLSLAPTSLQSQSQTIKSSSQAFTQIRQRSNRSKRGLYDGRDIRAGNNVPFSLKKTKRTFKPNVFKKRLYSEILDEMIPFHVTSGALRSIDKYGGLDGYLLQSGMVEQGKNEGWLAKQRIMQKIQDCEIKGVTILDDVVFKNEMGEEKKMDEKNDIDSAAAPAL